MKRKLFHTFINFTLIVLTLLLLTGCGEDEYIAGDASNDEIAYNSPDVENPDELFLDDAPIDDGDEEIYVDDSVETDDFADFEVYEEADDSDDYEEVADSDDEDSDNYEESDALSVLDELSEYTESKSSDNEDSESEDDSDEDCRYNRRTGKLLCSNTDGCTSKYLSVASDVSINGSLSRKAIKRLKNNKHLRSLKVKDMSNFTQKDIQALYTPLSAGDIAMAALLFSYKNSKDSVGNSGTKMYRLVMKKKCPSITILRSCASVVSGAMNGAGVSDYASAATAGLVSYYKESSEWKNLGRLPKSKMKSGDIIFIDRKSHSKRAVHDHVCVWVGNEKIQRLFPDSTGNSVSGSYDENYKKARSAAVTTFSFTGDYRIYRHISNR